MAESTFNPEQLCLEYGPILASYRRTNDQNLITELTGLLYRTLTRLGISHHTQVWSHLMSSNNQLDISENVEKPEQKQVKRKQGHRSSLVAQDRKREGIFKTSPREFVVLHFAAMRGQLIILHSKEMIMLPVCWFQNCQQEPMCQEYMLCESHYDNYRNYILNTTPKVTLLTPFPDFSVEKAEYPYQIQEKFKCNTDGARRLNRACETLICFLKLYVNPKKTTSWCSICEWNHIHEEMLHSYLSKGKVVELYDTQLAYSLYESCVLFRFKGETKWQQKCNIIGCFHSSILYHSTCSCHASKTDMDELIFSFIMRLAGIHTWEQMTAEHHNIIRNKIKFIEKTANEHEYTEIGNLRIGISDGPSGHIQVKRPKPGRVSISVEYVCSNYGAHCKTINNTRNCRKCSFVRTYKPAIVYQRDESIFLAIIGYRHDGTQSEDESYDLYLTRQEYKPCRRIDVDVVLQSENDMTQEEASSFLVAGLLFLRAQADYLGIEHIRVKTRIIFYGQYVWKYFFKMLTEAGFNVCTNVTHLNPIINKTEQLFKTRIDKKDSLANTAVYEAWNVTNGLTYTGGKLPTTITRDGLVKFHVILNRKDAGGAWNDLLEANEDPRHIQPEIVASSNSLAPYEVETLRMLANSYAETVAFLDLHLVNRRTSESTFKYRVFLHELQRMILIMIGHTFSFEPSCNVTTIISKYLKKPKA